MSAEPAPMPHPVEVSGRAGTVPESAALDDIEAALTAAAAAEHPAERYVAAHRAALRVAAWVLASRRPRLKERCSVWAVIARVAPELGEWASYFALHQTRRQVVEAGAVALISAREADDLLRDAFAFRDAAHLTRGGIGVGSGHG